MVRRMVVAYEKQRKVLISGLLDELQGILHCVGTGEAAVDEVVEHIHDDKH